MAKPKVFYTLDSDTLERDFGIKSAKGLTFEEFLAREAKKEEEGFTFAKLDNVLKEKLGEE